MRNIPNKYSQQMLLDEINTRHEGTYDFFYLPIDFKVGGWVVDYRRRVPPCCGSLPPPPFLRHSLSHCASPFPPFYAWPEPVQRGLLLHQLPGAAVHPALRAELRGPAVEKLQLRKGAEPYVDPRSPTTLPHTLVLRS